MVSKINFNFDVAAVAQRFSFPSVSIIGNAGSTTDGLDVSAVDHASQRSIYFSSF
jgi:hypothetical protein